MFGLELVLSYLLHVRFAQLYASLIGPPLVNAFVLINAGADAAGTLPTFRERLERFIERAWAIVLIDAGITLFSGNGLDAMTVNDPSQLLQGIIVMFLTAMLVYAEPFAALEKETQPLTLVPFALLRSMMLAWVNIARVFALFAVEIALAIVELLLLRTVGTNQHAAGLLNLAFVTFTGAPLAALFAAAYLDTLAQERSAAS